MTIPEFRFSNRRIIGICAGILLFPVAVFSQISAAEPAPASQLIDGTELEDFLTRLQSTDAIERESELGRPSISHFRSSSEEQPEVQGAERINQAWSSDEFEVSGCSGIVYASVAINGQLYLGGRFTACGFAGASRIVRYDPSVEEFFTLGDGVDNDVYALTAIGSKLYVGGFFNRAGGSPAARIAVFDTTLKGNEGWSSLGSGVNGSVQALAAIGTDLFVGGQFSQSGGLASNLIARYDTTQSGNAGWAALGDGVNSAVLAMTALDGKLYVGGRFNQAGGSPANGIAVFDTSQNGNAAWSALGDGVNGEVIALATLQNKLYVGGFFFFAGGAPVSYIAAFDTTQAGNAGWSALGDGVDSDVQSLLAVGNSLYVGGSFDQAGGLPASRIAKFDTNLAGNAGWSSLEGEVSGSIRNIALIDDELYVGGTLPLVDGIAVNNIARFDTTQPGSTGWSPLASGMNSVVFATASIDDKLYVGGAFNQAGGLPASFIAAYDTTQPGKSGWSLLGDGLNGPVNALIARGNLLYVGGQFTEAGGMSASRVAVFDTTMTGNLGWLTLGDGVNGTVNALTFVDDDLYVGGSFTAAGGLTANSIAAFDTTQTTNAGWSALGDGANFDVNALTSIGTTLYIAGRFTQAGGTPASRIAAYDTSLPENLRWSALGDGVNNRINALDAIGDRLYVAGSFSQAGQDTANRIASYDTNESGNSGWASLGSGLNSSAVALTAIGDDLYVAGFFVFAGGLEVNRVARYDTTLVGNDAWSELGDGANNTIRTLTSLGNVLYAGGDFTLAGGRVNGYLASYDTVFNLAPAAQNDEFSQQEDVSVTDNLFLDNGSGPDSDPDGNSFELQSSGTFAASGIGGSVTTQVNGDFSYTPPLNASGVATFDYTIADPSGATDSATVTITVQPVNDQPSFSALDPAPVLEDSGAQTLPDWASFDAGAPDEPDAVLAYMVSNITEPGLFDTAPAVDNFGTLTYTPADNAFGTSTFQVVVQDDGGTDKGGVDTSTSTTFTITIDPVNDAPSLTAADPTAVDEDAGAQVFPGWASFDPGPEESGQSALAYTVSNISDPALFSAGPSVDAAGQLTYTPAADANGSSTFEVTVQDDGGTANGGADTSAPQMFTITVDPVNDAPTFSAADPAAVDEDAGAQALPGWTTFDPGPEESDQSVLAYTVGNVSDPALFADGPSVDATGELTYTPAADANGSSTFEVSVQDDGGTANGGSDTSAPQTFTITVNPVNDAPTFSATDPTAVDEDAGPQALPGWASFDPGPEESEQSAVAYTVSNISDPGLFAAGPSVDAAGQLTFTPAADANGSSAFDVAVQDDGGTANGGTDTSAPQTFTITVNPVNDPPTFTSGGDVIGVEDTPFSSPWASGISSGPADESGQSVSFLVTANSDPTLFASGPIVDASGQLSFTPASDTTGTVQIEVAAMDDGGTTNGGDDTSAPATFTVEVAKAADLSIDKTSGSFFTPSGGALSYDLVVTNPGPSDVVDARVEDPEPARLTFGNWQCAPVGAASCNTATGTGPVDMLVTIPEGDSVTVTVDAQLNDNDAIPITNTATVTAPADVTELEPGNNGDSDTDLVGLFADGMESVEPD